MLTARELDRQTSVGRFPQADALQFLDEAVAMRPTEPEYFNSLTCQVEAFKRGGTWT